MSVAPTCSAARADGRNILNYQPDRPVPDEIQARVEADWSELLGRYPS